MGGNAFNLLHPDAKFPRIQPAVYKQLKEKFHEVLQVFYKNVATPREAPEKLDHGDIDFIVHGPHRDVTHEDLERAFGSKWSVPPKGENGIGNFAIPAMACAELGAAAEDEHYQVDVRVCSNEADFHRVVFFYGYGDLGMILGLMARGVGLAISPSGLKLGKPLPTYPPITFRLSSSFDEIMPFFGLSIERWNQGFDTQREIFDWVSGSPFFDARHMARSDANHIGGRKAREVRTMYQNFLIYAEELSSKESKNSPRRSGKDDKESIKQAAITYFRKKELYDRLIRVAKAKEKTKTVFTGKLVTQWTNLRGPPVRWVMEEVRKRLGCLGEGTDTVDGPFPLANGLANLSISESSPLPHTEEPSILPTHLALAAWERSLEGMSLNDVQTLVVKVKEEMYCTTMHNWREEKSLKAEQKALA